MPSLLGAVFLLGERDSRLAVPRILFCYRRVGPVDHIALLHLAHEKEDVFAHLNMLTEGQIRHEKPSAGAL